MVTIQVFSSSAQDRGQLEVLTMIKGHNVGDKLYLTRHAVDSLLSENRKMG